MKVNLQLHAGLDGGVAHHTFSSFQSRFLHRHDELELNLVIQGTGTYIADNRKYDLITNTQIWFLPNQEHCLIDQTRDLEMWVVIFGSGLLRRVCVTPQTRVLLIKKPKGVFCKTLSEYQASRLRTLFEEAFRCRNDPAYLNASIAYGLMFAWLSHIADDRVALGSDVHPAVEKAARLLNREPSIHSMIEIAGYAGLSPSRLRKLFKGQTGISIVAFRNKQRLRRFFQLYGHGQRINMMEAALEAGFGSYPQFHRVFKQIMGHGPAAYRRMGAVPGDV